MKAKKLKDNLLKISILLIPFEGFGMSIRNSYWSPSYIFLVISFCLVFFSSKKFHKQKALCCFLLITFLLLNLIAAGDELNFFRYLRSSIAILVLFFLTSTNFSLKKKNKKRKEFYQIFCLSISICCVFIWLQFILRNYFDIYFFSSSLFPRLNNFIPDRYQGFMVEPSYAGYVITSLLSHELFILFVNHKKLKRQDSFKRFLFVSFLLSSLYLTSSTHMITLVLTISISIIIEFKIFLRNLCKFIFKNVFSTVLIFALVTLLLSSYFSGEHFQDRFFGQQTNNLSTLSWLRGYENMITTLNHNPWLGYGLGNNYRAFEKSAQTSLYQDVLEASGLSELNKNDSFSLFFRIFSEGGLILTMLMLYFMGNTIYQSRLNNTSSIKLLFNINDDINLKQQKYYYVIFIAACLGALLKEPSYYNYLIPLTIILL